jgi:hypothetical protein
MKYTVLGSVCYDEPMGRMIESSIEIPAGIGNTFLVQSVHTVSASHLASYPIDTGFPSLGVKHQDFENNY